MEGNIVYFEKVGRENTEETLSIAKERAEKLGIKTILMASTYGDTAARAVEIFEGFRVIAVSHATGHREPNVQEFTEENRQKIESKGGRVLISTEAFVGLTRTMRYDPSSPEAAPRPIPQSLALSETGTIVARTLRIFGAGMKVVCQIAMMAADAGLVRTDEDVIVIAGSGRGADTAVVLKPVNSIDFFSLRIKEILCKPHLATTPQR